MNFEENIFKRGSTTFFTSTKFFPSHVRDDIFELYSFVRVADDYVDQTSSDKDGFYRLRRIYDDAISNPGYSTKRQVDDDVDTTVVKNIVRQSEKHNFNPIWVEAFLNSMQADLVGKKYETLDDTLEYVHGSAEVIGLMMVRIMGLPQEAGSAAMMQGRAMQFINFIRDVGEDNSLGRQYFPLSELNEFNLKNLLPETASAQPEDFANFIQFQINRYKKWQVEAGEGYKYVPKRMRIALVTASSMYDWTADKIAADPQIVFREKLKPSKAQILRAATIASLSKD